MRRGPPSDLALGVAASHAPRMIRAVMALVSGWSVSAIVVNGANEVVLLKSTRGARDLSAALASAVLKGAEVVPAPVTCRRATGERRDRASAARGQASTTAIGKRGIVERASTGVPGACSRGAE